MYDRKGGKENERYSDEREHGIERASRWRGPEWSTSGCRTVVSESVTGSLPRTPLSRSRHMRAVPGRGLLPPPCRNSSTTVTTTPSLSPPAIRFATLHLSLLVPMTVRPRRVPTALLHLPLGVARLPPPPRSPTLSSLAVIARHASGSNVRARWFRRE